MTIHGALSKVYFHVPVAGVECAQDIAVFVYRTDVPFVCCMEAVVTVNMREYYAANFNTADIVMDVLPAVESTAAPSRTKHCTMHGREGEHRAICGTPPLAECSARTRDHLPMPLPINPTATHAPVHTSAGAARGNGKSADAVDAASASGRSIASHSDTAALHGRAEDHVTDPLWMEIKETLCTAGQSQRERDLDKMYHAKMEGKKPSALATYKYPTCI